MNLGIPATLLLVLAGAAVLMAILWLISRPIRNAALVDVGWASGLGLAAIFLAVAADGDPARRIIVAALAGVWSSRLTWHLLRDRIIGAEEEGRYAKYREKWGDKFQPRMFLFFQAQALLVAILATPFAIAASAPDPAPSALDIIAVIVWITGIVGESVADAQLHRFKKNPDNKGKVCDVGLWRYSRHPNYFFEWLMWVAYGLLALNADPAFGWVGLLGPALILLFVLKITGIPPTEARALESRGDAYREYQKRTSPFIPLPPRNPDA